MRVMIVFHSLSGNTRRVAELLAGRLEGVVEAADLVEVHDLHQYSTLTAYMVGVPRAMRGEAAAVDPVEIDVTDYDVVVVGTPVWAFAPTPAVNGAVAALRGAEGKDAVVFVTSGGAPGEAAERLGTALERRGPRVRGAVLFDRRNLENEERIDELVALVTRPPSGG